jgi:regulatory protein YycH of two-component signal transduction system YycFG
MNAPILVEPRVSAEAMARLSSLAESLQLLQERSDKTTHSLDQILRQYHVMVTEIAEKTVIIDAELARRGV